jgi:hypothetical protein
MTTAMVREVSPTLSELCGKSSSSGPVQVLRLVDWSWRERYTIPCSDLQLGLRPHLDNPLTRITSSFGRSTLFPYPHSGSRKPSTSTPAEKKAHRAKVKAQTSLIASLSPEELAAAQRRALLAQYGYVEDENVVQDDAGTAGAGSGMRGETLRKREEEKEAKERRALIDASVIHHLIFLLRIPFEAVRRWL